MNTASVSEAVTTPSWSTPGSSAPTQSWPASTGYEYYNYYPTVPPPAAATATSAPAAVASTAPSTTNYQQDYNQAWDEYYKAIYGQSYATPATTVTPTATAAAQYPTNYSYDQYGYANFSAPPPNYYQPAPQTSTYDYTQTAAPAAPSSTYPAYNTVPAAPLAPTTNWSEPPPAFVQPASYNNAPQPYDQLQPFNQPPPLSTTNYKPMEPNTMMHPHQPHSTDQQQLGMYGDQFANKPQQQQQGYMDPKMYDANSATNFRQNQQNQMPQTVAKEASYLEQFPPPSFGSPIKPANRGGRGGVAGGSGGFNPNNFNMSRGARQQSGNRGNFNPINRNAPFNRGGSGGYGNQGDRRQFGVNNTNEYGEDNSMNSSNVKTNNMSNRRGRGGFHMNRGRTVDSQGTGYQQQQQRSDPWYQEDEVNEEERNEVAVGGGSETTKGGFSQNEFEEDKDSFNNNKQNADARGFSQNEYDEKEYFQNKSQEGDDSGYGKWNTDKVPSHHNQTESFDNQKYSQRNESSVMSSQGQKRDFDQSKFSRNTDQWSSNQKQGFNNQEFPSRTGGQQQRDGGYFQGSNNLRPQPARGLRNFNREPFQPNRNQQHQQPFGRNNASSGAVSGGPPVKLMDVVVNLSPQSPVIKRRQMMIDQWQREIKEMHNRRIQINYYFPLIKSALCAESQELFLANCCSQNGSFVCELLLDDVFIVQTRADSEQSAVESASKSVFETLKNNVFVVPATREADGEEMPGFCISTSPHGAVELPPICRMPDLSASQNSFLMPTDAESEVVVSTTGVVKPSAPSSQGIGAGAIGTQSSDKLALDPGLFLVLESATNERDQSIASLVATARFNNTLIEYQHEKLPHAPHISLCVITINGVEIDRHEARDYLVAKRQAADKVVARLKQIRPQITIRFDRAKPLKREDLKKDDDGNDHSLESAIKDYLDSAVIDSNEDILLKFDSDFTAEDKNVIATVATNLKLNYKNDTKNCLYVFKQFSVEEMKRRLLDRGFCAQYQLVDEEQSSGFSSPSQHHHN